MTPRSLFAALNIGFVILLGVGVGLGNPAGVHALYLLTLFVVCTAPLLSMQQLNDRYALLGIFGANYFLLFGALDLAHLFIGLPPGTEAPVIDTGMLSTTECLILSGYVVLHACYLIACQAARPAIDTSPVRDWSERTLIVGGLLLWSVSTYLVWQLNVNILVKLTNDVVGSAYANMNPLQVIAYMLAGYFQPVGIVILAYAQVRYRRTWLMAVLAAMVAVEMVYGFVADSKGQVLIGLALIALTQLLVRGRLPIARLAVVGLVAVMVFPILQANRVVRGEYDLSHADALQQIGRTLDRALDATARVSAGPERADTLLERMSLKANVELIVDRTGNGIDYQHGHTLAPLLGVFIPRILWAGKEEVKTGQLFNQTFSIADSDSIYISTSHLGELYWNFGWTGTLIGMAVIGIVFGIVGARTDLSEQVNITRILLLLATVKLVVLGFESSIATQYSMWIRSLLGFALMRALLAREVSDPQGEHAQTGASAQSDGDAGPLAADAPAHANLMV